MNRTSHIGQMLVLVGFLGASRIFFHVYLDYTADDAYTTYRYARNIANGEGFVYNLGERVQGTSTPLFTLILAGCGYAVGVEHIPLASRVIAFVADITSLVLLWIVLSEATELARFVACALLVVYPKVVLVSVSGMEAPIVVVLMLLSYVLLFNLNSPKAAIVVLVLLLACRMDAIIWIGVCVWRAGWPQLKGAATVALVSGCIYVGWLVFSYLYFGSFLPNVLIAKVVSYSHLFPWFDPVRVFGGYVPFEGLKGHAFVVRCAAFTLLLFPPIVQLVRLIRRPSPLVAFPLFFWHTILRSRQAEL